MSAENRYDVIVIGGGPGGYTAAIRAGQLGLKVACIDENPALGGTCLRVGCIPSKALLESSERYVDARDNLAEHGINVSGVELDLHAVLRRKDKVVTTLTRGIDFLLKKNKVDRIQGRGRLDGPGRVLVERTAGATKRTTDKKVPGADGAETLALEAEHIILATGSRVAELAGIDVDGERIVTSTEALGFQQVPEHLIVIGAGYIGVELGSVWARLGAKVTVLEYMDRILPGLDADVAAEAKPLLEKQGLNFRLGTKVTGARVEGEQVTVEIEGAEPVTGDRVLVAVGRVPNTANLGLETVGISTDERGRIPVNARFQTAAAGVYAVGDIIAGPMLAHKAEKEGIACVEAIAGLPIVLNYDAIPAVVFTKPEIASVGKTEQELIDAGVTFRKGTFPFRANGRARTLGQAEGFVKVLADAETDRLLGVHIIGPNAGELIAEAATAMEFGASAEDLATVTHAHPTLAETLKEAALAVHGRAIHA